MQQIGNKLIEIQVTDSSLATPEAGAGFIDSFGGMVDGLSSTPALMVILIALAVAVPLCILAIVLSRLHHKRTNRTSAFSKALLRFTPIAAAIAIVAAPLLSIAAPDPLNNSAISIKIDKATALTAADTTTVELDQEATSHVDIYAELDNDFNGNLGTDLLISATNTNDSSSTTNLSTTNSLVYTTSPVIAGDTTDFQIAVSITEDLQVGNYSGEINFYGDFVQAPETITVTFLCYADPDNDDWTEISTDVDIELGSMYDLPVSSSLGCNDDDTPYPGWLEVDGQYDSEYYYLPGNGQFYYWGDNITTKAVSIQEASSVFITRFYEPVDEPWYENCYLSWDDVFCTQYFDEMDEWWNSMYSGYDAWEYDDDTSSWLYSQQDYENWSRAYRNWASDFNTSNGAYPIFDGMVLSWGVPG